METIRMKRRFVTAGVALSCVLIVSEGRAETPAGQMTWALHFTPAPTLFEPAETPGLITPFLFLDRKSTRLNSSH